MPSFRVRFHIWTQINVSLTEGGTEKDYGWQA